MRTRWVPFVVGAAFVAGLAWWLLGSWEGHPVADYERPRHSAAAAPPGLGAPPSEPDAASAPRAAGSSFPPGFDPRPLEGGVEGIVVRNGEPTPASVELRRARSSHELKGVEDATRIVTGDVKSVAVADAGPDGRFRFPGLPPGTYHLLAVAQDGAVGTAHVAIRARGSLGRVTVALGGAGVLRGRVVHADGKPWTGDVFAFVAWIDMFVIGTCVARAEADSNGRFTLDRLPADWVHVMAVEEDGDRALGEPVELPSDAEYVLDWEAARRWVEGRVVSAEDGSPIAGAKVVGTYEFDASFRSADTARTDAEGRFRVLVPDLQDGRVMASAAGFVPATSAVAKQGAMEFSLVPRSSALPEARIRGVVIRRADRAPVSGASVHVVPVGGQERPSVVVRSGVDGTFLAELPDVGTYTLWVSGEDQVSAAHAKDDADARRAATVTLRPGDETRVELETVVAGRVVGTVHDADGAPVEGATVMSRSGQQTPTGRGGAFELHGFLPEDDQEIVARSPAGLPSAVHRVRVGLSETRRLDIVLPAPRWLDVFVVDARTQGPIARAYVKASTGGKEWYEQRAEWSSRTDASGRARLGPLGPETISLSVDAQGFTPKDINDAFELTVGPAALSAVVRLEPRSNRRVSGRVIRPDGQPAADALVWLDAVGHGTSTRTGKDGSFSFDDVAEGDSTVRAVIEEEGLASGSQPAPADSSPLTLRLTLRGVVARVVDPDGRPVPHARARYGNSSGHVVSDGRLAIDLRGEDASGRAETLEVYEAATRPDGPRMPLGPARVDGVRPGVEVVVRMPPGRVIEGRVLAPDGKPVVGASVRALPLGGSQVIEERAAAEEPDSSESGVSTDGTGAFRIDYLAEGPHWVAVFPSTALAAPRAVEHAADGPKLEIRLRAAVSATVAVLGPDGRPVPHAQVVAVRQSGQWVGNLFAYRGYSGWSTKGQTGDDGRVRLDGLDPEEAYALGVRGPSAVNVRDATDPRWRPADTTVRLSAGLVVSGRVLDSQGRPLRNVEVRYGRETDWRPVTVGDDGTFRAVGLDPGKVTLAAQSGRSTVKMEVDAGAEGVDLRFE